MRKNPPLRSLCARFRRREYSARASQRNDSLLRLVVILLACTLSVNCDAASGAFSTEGEHVYLVGPLVPNGKVMDVDLQSRSSLPLDLGVKDFVVAVSSGPEALFFVTMKVLWAYDFENATTKKICDAPADWRFTDVAYDSSAGAILLPVFASEQGSKAPSAPRSSAYYLKKGSHIPVELEWRRIRFLEGPVFDSRGDLFFATEGDVWHGHIDARMSNRPILTAYRLAPLATRETYNGTPAQMGARDIAVAGNTIYTHVRRMGGSGWGTLVSIQQITTVARSDKNEAYPIPAVWLDNKNFAECIALYQSALRSIKYYGENDRTSYLCASQDGKRAFFATEESKQDAIWHYWIGDDTGLAKEIELKIHSIPATVPEELQNLFQSSGLSASSTADLTAKPLFLAGDFDGDGKTDYVLRLHSAETKASDVAVLFGDRKMRLFSTQKELGHNYPGPNWRVHRKGETIPSVPELNQTRSAPNLDRDAIELMKPESSRAIVYWNGMQFSIYWIAD